MAYYYDHRYHAYVTCATVFTIGPLTGRNGFGVKVYFFATVTTGKPVGYGTWENSVINGESTSASGKNCGAYIGIIYPLRQWIHLYFHVTEFSQASDEVVLEIALSLQTVDQVNITHQMKHF